MRPPYCGCAEKFPGGGGTGLPLAHLDAARQRAEQQGLLNPDPQRLQASPRGQLFLNDLLQLFL